MMVLKYSFSLGNSFEKLNIYNQNHICNVGLYVMFDCVINSITMYNYFRTSNLLDHITTVKQPI